MDGELKVSSTSSADSDLEVLVHRVCTTELPREFESLNFSVGLDAWMKAVFACNQYVDEQAPWALRKDDPERMEAVLMTLFRCVRSLAIAVRCVVPTSADRLLDQMGIPAEARDFAALEDTSWIAELVNSGFRLDKPEGIFPRLDLPESETA